MTPRFMAIVLGWLLGMATAAEVRAESSEAKLVKAARDQVGVTVRYDPAYVVLDFPNGDVPQDRGVCTDVFIRALRSAVGVDLQLRVNQDMKSNFAQYPKRWGLTRPDKNIDHRRVPNLQVWFQRHGQSLKPTRSAVDYRPGDIVTCLVAGNLPHVMIVSDRKDGEGTPLVIHNIGNGTQEEPRLFEFPLTGHYRLNFGKIIAPAAGR